MRGVQNKYRIEEQTFYSGKKEYVVQKRKILSFWWIILFLLVPIVGWICLYDLLTYGEAEIGRNVKFDNLKSAEEYINIKIEEYKETKHQQFMNSIINRKIIR